MEKGKIVSKTQADLVAEGVIQLQEPYEYLKGDKIATRSVATALKSDMVKTKAQALEGLRRLRETIELQIAEVYTKSDELKRSKDYLAWIVDGRPDDDDRRLAYEEMQKTIGAIKRKYKKEKEELKKRIN